VQILCIQINQFCFMRKIGFRNFRRFKDFGQIEINGITFIVGKNNSGKSTLVKAILLLNNYFKSSNFDSFQFGNEILEDVNIVTYGRAKNIQAEENLINFVETIENYAIQIDITGNDDQVFGNVFSLRVHDTENEIFFIFDFQNRRIQVVKNKAKSIPSSQIYFLESLEKELAILEKDLENMSWKKTSKEYIELVSKIENINQKRELLYNERNDPNQNIVSAPEFILEDSIDSGLTLKEIVNRVLTRSEMLHDIEFKKIQEGEKSSEGFEHLRAFKEYGSSKIANSFIHFMSIINDDTITYMGANPTKQSALFAIRDKNNSLAQAIHDFQQLNISSGEEEYRFVIKWFKLFEVGNDFKITMHGGEAYELKISSDGNYVQIADKGMGSIQAVLLIMRIACVIRRIKQLENNLEIQRSQNRWEELNSNLNIFSKRTLIIEEPELNLHPALQSKLADLFLEVNQKYNINFLIETHSEYILRRSQVLVAEYEFEVAPNENPFRVYYFPNEKDKIPYRLGYQKDGSFDRNFGDGFFDEASSSTLELLKLKRQKKA